MFCKIIIENWKLCITSRYFKTRTNSSDTFIELSIYIMSVNIYRNYCVRYNYMKYFYCS